MKIIPAGLLSFSLLASTPLLAGNLDTDALLGGALGGAVGAVVGSELGGRNGAILGSAIGGAAGTALTTRHQEPPRQEVIYIDRPVRSRAIYAYPSHDNGPPIGHYKQKRKHRHGNHDD